MLKKILLAALVIVIIITALGLICHFILPLIIELVGKAIALAIVIIGITICFWVAIDT